MAIIEKPITVNRRSVLIELAPLLTAPLTCKGCPAARREGRETARTVFYWSENTPGKLAIACSFPSEDGENTQVTMGITVYPTTPDGTISPKQVACTEIPVSCPVLAGLQEQSYGINQIEEPLPAY